VTCEERSGLLFAHACDRASLYGCTVCGKAICIEHTRMGTSGPTCIACVATAEPGTDSDDDPYFYRHGRDDYHSRSYYDADDRDAFESDTTADDASDSAAEGDLGAS
jgi:hypothetical protein